MFKIKLYSFAIALMIGCVGMKPANVSAADANSGSITLSEKDKDQKDQRATFEETITKANEKWNTLSSKQKSEVYALLENEMIAEFKLIDKLVEFGVFSKEDAATISKRMLEKLNELKTSGEFPLSRPRRNKK